MCVWGCFTAPHSYILQVHPLFILSVADFVLAILWLIGGIVWLNPDEYGWAKEGSATHTGMCYVLAVATTVSIGYIVCIYMTMVSSIVKRQCSLNPPLSLSVHGSFLRWLK